jgi:hypothetical protein
MRTCNILLIILLSITSLSCFTVKYSTSGASIPPDAKTFSVDYFSNKAPIAPPELGQKLTESLKDKFIGNTRLSLVSRNGDLTFEGEITQYDIKPVNIQSDDQAGNMRLTMQVKVTFVNMKAHEWDFSTNFSQYIDLSADQLEPLPSQIDELNDKIIDEIFNKSVANW